MVVDHNDIANSHTCSYALTDHRTGLITDFGVLSDLDDREDIKDTGGQVLRKALKNVVNEKDKAFTIYNHSDYMPQLEMSRFPDNLREKVYENKSYNVKDSASGTSSYTGEFLVKSAIDFISTNYSRFESPVSTDKPPRLQKPSETFENNSKYNCQFRNKGEYYLYTDASYHPKRIETGISLVIIGKNGGMYAMSMKVDSQTIARAELLAFLKGVMIIQKQTNRSFELIAHTDSMDVKNAIEEDLIIDRGLNNKIEELLNEDTIDLDMRCIGRESNALPDALAKVGRSNGKIEVGKLSTQINV